MKVLVPSGRTWLGKRHRLWISTEWIAGSPKGGDFVSSDGDVVDSPGGDILVMFPLSHHTKTGYRVMRRRKQAGHPYLPYR